MPSRVRVLCLALSSAVALALAAPSVVAAPSKSVLIPDEKSDVSGAMDLQKVKFSVDAAKRLRVAITFAHAVKPAAMLATKGPPGSVCVRIWTATDADPEATRADRLACVTARSKTALRARVYKQDGPGLPVAVAEASVSRSKSNRSFVIRITPASLGDPRRVRLAVESTRPGCDRTTCIDTAPDAPKTRLFRLR
ncbi:MAG: hypothetical protein QOG15_2671 [Solirubrobacteraceae bacterium]|jgi:hypothetical protein|nr:hypothetical protein [Solirubrobacteraceae bacterium]